jgi:hypothetical protein
MSLIKRHHFKVFGIATVILVLVVSGLIRARTNGHFTADCRYARYAKTPMWYMMWKEGVHFFLLVWIAQTLIMVREFP